MRPIACRGDARHSSPSLRTSSPPKGPPLITSSPSELSEFMTGRVVLPGDADWDAARQSFNLLVDAQPAAVAFPVDERDVIAVVNYAREHGLRVAPQATAHNLAAHGELAHAILVHVAE